MLSIQNISKNFGGIKAVNNVSLKIKRGSITGLIGPNGAGKSTLFNIIAGNLPSDSGNIILEEEDITHCPSHELFDKGLLRTFQIAHEFSKLTVLENLMVVPGSQTGEKLIGAWFNHSKVKSEEIIIRKKALEVIEFLKLDHLTHELAGNLSGGQKKLLELGRTMMVDAKLVLLDEVGAGVNRTLLKDISSTIMRLNKERGYTFCMIEHDIDFISELCDWVAVMAEGKVLTQGNIEEIKNIKSEKSDLRNFGIIVGIILLIISGYLFWKEKESFQIFLAIGITLFLTSITIPVILKPVYLIWMIFATILGWTMTRVILSLLFYFIITPIGLTLRFFGKQFLELRWDKSQDSYWNFRTNEHRQNENYEKQF